LTISQNDCRNKEIQNAKTRDSSKICLNNDDDNNENLVSPTSQSNIFIKLIKVVYDVLYSYFQKHKTVIFIIMILAMYFLRNRLKSKIFSFLNFLYRLVYN